MERLRELADVLAKQDQASAIKQERMGSRGDFEGLQRLSHLQSRVAIAIQELELRVAEYGGFVGVGIPPRPEQTIRCFGMDIVRR